MTATVITAHGDPVGAKPIKRRFLNAPSRRASSSQRRTWSARMTTPTRPSDQMQLLAGGNYIPASPPGAIGGAVIKASRHSAGLSRRQLARQMTVSSATVRRWEDGTCPLFCMNYDQLRRLAAALDQQNAGATYDLGELLLASQCDLLVTGMLRGFEDYAEVPPIDEPTPEGDHARDLLRWALTGIVPDKYRPHAAADALLTERDVTAFTAIVQDLSSKRDRLNSYGVALAKLASV